MTLPGEVAIVIRGGSARDPDAMLEGLLLAAQVGKPQRVSVFAVPIEPTESATVALDKVCRAARAPWGKVQVSTVQRLRDRGFELLDERDDDERDCHFHVGFNESVTLEEVKRFISCFDEPQVNPVPKAERTT